MTQYAVTTQPIDGLTLSASYYDFGQMGKQDGRQKKEGGSLAANFNVGQFSVGYGETRHAPAQQMGGSAAQTKLTTMLTKVTVSVLQLTTTYQYL